MVEIAARYVSIYPKIATGFSSEVNAAIKKGVGDGKIPINPEIPAPSKKKLGDVFKSVVAPVLTAAAAVAVLKFVRTSVDAFSKLEDATAAASVVFGASMAKVEASAESASKALGISKQEYIDGAITMGTFGKSAGLTGDSLANFSTQMVQTAGDMASFRGTTPEQAIEAVGAALRGEMEPIRQYGVLLDDASLRQQALAMGLIKTTKEALTPQQKVLAAQAAILKQTSDAQGDFARTSDSTANTQKMLAAESANLSAEIGGKLAPSIVAAQKAGIGLLQWTSANMAALVPLAGALGTVTLAVGGFVLAAKGVEALKSARETVKGMGDAFTAMGTKAKVAVVSMGAIGVALTAASLIYGAIAQKQAEATQAVEDYTAAIEADTGALGDNVRAAVAKRLEDSGALAAAQKLGVSLTDVTDAILGNGDALARVQQATTGSSQASWILSDAISAENVGMQAGIEAAKRKADATDTGTTATKGATSATQSGTIAFAEYKKSIDSVYNANLKMRGDQRAVEAAIDDATAAAKKNGKTLDINTAKGRDNQAALDAIASAALSVAGGMSDADVASGKAGRVMNENRAEFVKAATSMGKSRKAAEELADELGLIKSKKVDVEVHTKQTGPKTFALVADARRNRWNMEVRAQGGAIRGPGTGTSDSIPAMLSNGEHVLTADEVRSMGGHDGVYRMRSLAKSGALHFASGGPVMPSYNGHSLDWWQDYLLSDVDYTRMQIQIRDLKSSLTETEIYNPPGAKKRAKRQKLRGLDRTAAQQELRDAQQKLSLAAQAAKANSSAAGSIADQIAKYEAEKAKYSDATQMWQDAAQSLSKSAGFGSMDSASVKRSNAAGDVWYEKRALTAADLSARVTEQAGQVETFIGLLDQLRKAGASEALISDVLSLGTVEGTKAARLFLADATQMAIANSAYARLQSANGALGAIGNSSATVSVTINEAATPQATTQAVLNGILAGRS